MHGDLRELTLDLAEVIGSKFDFNRSDILDHPLQISRAGNGDDPRLLREQPGERDLSRRYLLSFCDRVEQIDHRLIGFPGLQREARERGPKV